jgi:NTE family protein
LRGGKFQLPRGLVHGQKLLLTLRRATLPVADIEQFDQLPIPFRAVATDIATGEAVVLREGQLASALRASMSAPGVFSPVELDGRLLVDGGIADNLPVEVARAMGVDILIAVDVSFPLYPKNELRSALQISNQTLAILIGREAARQRALLGSGDILVSPPLGGMGSTEFNKVEEAIAAGEQAARAMAPRLAAFSVSPAEYAAFQARQSEHTPTPARIEFVSVDEDSGRYKKLVAAAMAPAIGETVDSPKVDQASVRDARLSRRRAGRQDWARDRRAAQILGPELRPLRTRAAGQLRRRQQFQRWRALSGHGRQSLCR